LGAVGCPPCCSTHLVSSFPPHPTPSPPSTPKPQTPTLPNPKPPPQGSLYDVLRKARREPAFAARLTWPRRLLMALDAAKGLFYLHSHRPVILHRDLKSPNLLVAKDWRVQVRGLGLGGWV